MALWHERDISHSSAERLIFPDATGLLAFMLRDLTWVLDGLVVFPERMRENLEVAGGIAFSQSVLLALVDAGMSRDEAYRIVQRAAAAGVGRGRGRSASGSRPTRRSPRGSTRPPSTRCSTRRGSCGTSAACSTSSRSSPWSGHGVDG